MYAIALPAVQHRHHAPPDPLGSLFEAFDLIRGLANVFRSASRIVEEGPLRPMSQVSVLDQEDTTIIHLAPTAERRQLLERVQSFTLLLEVTRAANAEEEQKLKHCREAHAILGRIAHNVMMRNEQVSGHEVLAWPAVTAGEYVGLLRAHFPPALPTLGYFCLLLRNDCWYTQGWRSWTINILAGLDVPAPWHNLLQWSADQVKDVDFLDIRRRR